MGYERRMVAQIERMGRQAQVLVRETAGQNTFSNATAEYTPDHTVLTFRTYPNRNTQVGARVGEYHRDRPVFLFPRDTHADEPPGDNDRLRYPADGGRLYEMQARTVYETHVEIFGEVVTDG